jgi:hypothetical protein
MRALFFPLASAALLLAACSSSQSDSLDAGPDSSDPARSKPRSVETSSTPTLTLSSFKVHDGLGNTGPLDLDSLRQLVIDAAYTAAPGTHSQLIDVLDPHGILYASLKSKVVADANGSVLSSQPLQVASTTIEQFRMVGTWQFVLIVDGQGLASVTLEILE